MYLCLSVCDDFPYRIGDFNESFQRPSFHLRKVLGPVLLETVSIRSYESTPLFSQQITLQGSFTDRRYVPKYI